MPLNPLIPLSATLGPMIDLGKNRAEAAQLADVLQTQQMRQEMFARQQQQWQREDQTRDVVKKHGETIRADNITPLVNELYEIDPLYAREVETNWQAGKDKRAAGIAAMTAAERQTRLDEAEDLGNLLNSLRDPATGKWSPDGYAEIYTGMQQSGNKAVAMLPSEELVAPDGKITRKPKWDERAIEAAVLRVPALKREIAEEQRRRDEANKPIIVGENSRALVADPDHPGQFKEIASPAPKPADYGVPAAYADAYIREVAKLQPGATLNESQQRDMQARYSASRRDPNSQADASLPTDVAPPLDPSSQDLMSQAGLSYNGFLALTGKMSQLPRDAATRNQAAAEVASWARERGMDVSTLASQYKAYNEALENNIARYNRTLLAEGEITADVENLIKSAKDSGYGNKRAINAAQQWLKGELNDPGAAQYAFFLNQLTNDIALYNAASQGRAALQADLEDAKSVVQRGVSAGSLTGMQTAIGQSVEKMGTVLEGAVNRSRQNVWELFGVGDKYRPTTKSKADPDAPSPKLKAYLDTLTWTPGKSKKINGDEVWMKMRDGTYKKVTQ